MQPGTVLPSYVGPYGGHFYWLTIRLTNTNDVPNLYIVPHGIILNISQCINKWGLVHLNIAKVMADCVVQRL